MIIPRNSGDATIQNCIQNARSKRFRSVTKSEQLLVVTAVQKQSVKPVTIAGLFFSVSKVWHAAILSLRQKVFLSRHDTPKHLIYQECQTTTPSQWTTFLFPLGGKSNKSQILWSTKVLALIVSCDVWWHWSQIVTLAGSRARSFLRMRQKNKQKKKKNSILNTQQTFPSIDSCSFRVSWEANLTLYSSTAKSGMVPKTRKRPDSRGAKERSLMLGGEVWSNSKMCHTSLRLIYSHLKATFELKSGDPQVKFRLQLLRPSQNAKSCRVCLL